jgi:hypothetical protein
MNEVKADGVCTGEGNLVCSFTVNANKSAGSGSSFDICVSGGFSVAAEAKFV